MTVKYDKGSGVAWPCGRIEWKVDGQYHREDGPAVEFLSSNTRYWYQYGENHRLDGPAVEYDFDGREFGDHCSWILHGKFAIDIWDQDIIVGKSIKIKDDRNVVLGKVVMI